MHALSIRLPKEIYDWLKAKAEKEDRSLNGQVNYLLRRLKQQEDQDDLSTRKQGENEQ